MDSVSQKKAKTAVRNAVRYLKSMGIRVPDFELTAVFHDYLKPGNSFVQPLGEEIQLNMGRYPNEFMRNWFAMHELGHILWRTHRPLRWKKFREEFGEPQPDDYEDIHSRESWKTAGSHKLSWFSGPHRPKGEPSCYGASAGGEERFCELLGLLYAHGDFSKSPPEDLEELWECCWNHGLSRMT